jgi:hypothetical protein
LVALNRDSLKALGVVTLDADENRQRRVGVALLYVDLIGAGAVESASKSPGWGSGFIQGSFSTSTDADALASVLATPRLGLCPLFSTDFGSPVGDYSSARLTLGAM